MMSNPRTLEYFIWSATLDWMKGCLFCHISGAVSKRMRATVKRTDLIVEKSGPTLRSRLVRSATNMSEKAKASCIAVRWDCLAIAPGQKWCSYRLVFPLPQVLQWRD